ncbi:MAG: GNAT family N-acetyltransferase [bacterium]|nr:GNAT family N-acetyltransferase [bacterium]
MGLVGLNVAELPAGDPAADALLDRFLADCPTSFAQQTPGWRNVITGVDRDEPRFLACRQGGELVGVLPAYRYSGPLGAILTSVPQAGPLGGVACHPNAEVEAVYGALLEGFIALAKSTSCELATVITNPFWPDRDLCTRHLRPDFVLENSCQVLELDRLDAGLGFEDERPALRRNLRKALAGDLYIDEEQTTSNVESWYAIHAQRHREIGAQPLPRELIFGALAHMVSRDKGRFFFVREKASNEMVAGGLYIHHGRVIDAVMPSMRSDRSRLAPNYLLTRHSMAWARERGLRFYNWQGSPPQGGVHRFKAQWGSRDAGYCFLTRVTGNAAPFLDSSVERIIEGYPWHYVLPFDRIGRGNAPPGVVSSRTAVWQARETSGR